MFDRKFDFQLLKVEKDNIGRRLDVCIKYEKQTFRLVNIYAPNIDDPNFYLQILNDLQTATQDHVVIGGI